MPNYKQSKIYKLVDNTNGNVYYGSTTQTYLSKRLSQHRTAFNGGNHSSSHEILKNNDYDIVLVELYPCNSKDELIMRERYYIENNKCVNKSIPGRTKLEYRYTDKMLEYNKQYVRDNKEKIALRHKKSYLYKKSWGGLLTIDMTLFH